MFNSESWGRQTEDQSQNPQVAGEGVEEAGPQTGDQSQKPQVAGEGLEEAGRPSAAKTSGKACGLCESQEQSHGCTHQQDAFTHNTHTCFREYLPYAKYLLGGCGEQSLDRTCTRSQLVLLLQRLLNEQSCVLVQETPLQEAPPTTASSGE